MVKDVRKYLFDKLFFPKVAIIDRPGIIINKTVSKFGKEGVKTRVIYHFEDIPVNLYLETVKKLGKEKTDDLWYKIGKDIAVRYLLFAKIKKIPKALLPLVIEHMFNTINSTGFTFGEKVNYNLKGKSLITHGKDCVICRKTKSGYFPAGIASGVLSFLLRENIEAEPHCNDCPKNCKIIASLKITKKYIPNIEELKPLRDYNKLNFPQNYKTSSEFKSFTDLLKFKKIQIGKKKGVFYFQDNVIIPSEVGLAKMNLKNYSEINELNLFKKIIIKTSEKIAENILQNEKSIEEKIKAINIMLSAFGWGLPYHKRIGNKIIYKFKFPPTTRYGPLFRALILNGYLNNIYNKKFNIKNITNERMEFIS